MIKENVVDLTGFVYNLMSNDTEKYTSIFFTLSVRNRYKDGNGQYITKYDNIPCTIYGNKDHNGNHRNSFNYFNKNLIEGQLIRVQGRISSWLVALIDNDLVPLTNQNKDQAKKIITRSNVVVTDYMLLESKEAVRERLKQKETKKEVPINKTEEVHEEVFEETESNAIDYAPDQGELFNPYFADPTFPEYRTFSP